jgi:hypothetical protein
MAQTAAEQQRIADLLNECSVIRLVAPDTDVTIALPGALDQLCGRS